MTIVFAAPANFAIPVRPLTTVALFQTPDHRSL
jgi:hypothetical protein